MFLTDNENAFLQFWSRAFGCSSVELSKGDCSFTSKGVYIEKHADKYVFFYQDQVNQKTVIAASSQIFDEIKREHELDRLAQLRYESIQCESWFKGKVLAFSDIDFYLPDASAFIPLVRIYDIRQIDSETSSLEEFYEDCSEDDKDTLDLTFEGEVAYGIYRDGRLSAVARYLQIRETRLADITVLVRPTERGQRLSAPLVSHVVEVILQKGLLPKYRVGSSNAPSIAIAKRLGFQERFRLLAWETGVEDHK